jgi:hypothetical protein
MRIKLNGNKADQVIVVIKSAEASATIAAGTPVVLVANGTNDGLAVVLPSTATASKTVPFSYGVAVQDIPAGVVGEACVFGVCNVKLTLQTRADTSGGSSFSTADTVALGALLTVRTAGNAFSTIANTVAAASSDNQTLSNYPVAQAAIFQSLASTAGIATATSETRTAVTQMVKAFLRMM